MLIDRRFFHYNCIREHYSPNLQKSTQLPVAIPGVYLRERLHIPTILRLPELLFLTQTIVNDWVIFRSLPTMMVHDGRLNESFYFYPHLVDFTHLPGHTEKTINPWVFFSALYSILSAVLHQEVSIYPTRK
jgi:uncharacterized protein (DUF427 family)